MSVPNSVDTISKKPSNNEFILENVDRNNFVRSFESDEYNALCKQNSVENAALVPTTTLKHEHPQVRKVISQQPNRQIGHLN